MPIDTHNLDCCRVIDRGLVVRVWLEEEKEVVVVSRGRMEDLRAAVKLELASGDDWRCFEASPSSEIQSKQLLILQMGLRARGACWGYWLNDCW